MPPEKAEDGQSLTVLLQAWREGSGTAFGSLLDQVYDQLREIAARRLGPGGSVTLSPTELVHEALLKVMPAPMAYESRLHFFASMSLVIRSILIDHARARLADKRGGNWVRITLTGLDPGEEGLAFDLIAIHQALERLEKLDARCGEVMHLTYFAGLPQADVAAMLGISLPTVERELRFARAWLHEALALGA